MDAPKEKQPWCLSHEEQFKRMDKTLYGNGREGLVSRFNKVETQFEMTVKILRVLAIILVPIAANAIWGLITTIIRLTEHLPN